VAGLRKTRVVEQLPAALPGVMWVKGQVRDRRGKNCLRRAIGHILLGVDVGWLEKDCTWVRACTDLLD